MKLLRFIRKKGYNQRHFAVIGTGNKAVQLVKDIENIKWLGLKCAFFVNNEPETDKKQLLGKPVYTPVSRILELVKTRNVDEVYLALDKNGADIYPILETLQSQGIIIRIVPSWGNLISISKPTIVPVGSQFLFSAGDSPLTGVNVIIKELFDRIVAFLLLVVFAVPMAIIALLIKLTSKGAVFYKQTRIGMDQRKFEMLKFRTMHINPEDQKTPKWTAENDSRRTGIGKFLRRTSIDELPQLINVLKGEMSLVGPRPEQPYFVEQFSENHRRYMLRHKVKAGMTGWAQIHGMRGDTSLRKRLVYDLYYVKNWSLALDLWILLRTPMHILKGENAY
jgi:exopolysaccharide biosynthesis polyprenyl glycosylphosphotransferase